jgi:hypothetical protein
VQFCSGIRLPFRCLSPCSAKDPIRVGFCDRPVNEQPCGDFRVPARPNQRGGDLPAVLEPRHQDADLLLTHARGKRNLRPRRRWIPHDFDRAGDVAFQSLLTDASAGIDSLPGAPDARRLPDFDGSFLTLLFQLTPRFDN